MSAFVNPETGEITAQIIFPAIIPDIATAISTPGGSGEVERVKLDTYLAPGQYDILKSMRGKKIAVTLQVMLEE